MKKIINRKIFTIFWIAIILIGIPLTIFVLKNQTVFNSRASGSQAPKNVKITNISDQSFTVAYQTDLPSTGSLSYGTDKQLGESALEDLDKENESFITKTIHNISVKNLAPSTKYYLAIISGSDTFLNNGEPFEITTGPEISSPSASEYILKGKIILPNGSSSSDAIVYVNTQDSQILSTMVAKNGEFSFSLSKLRTQDLTSYIDLNDNAVFNILATDGSLKSNVLMSINQTGTIPTITLSNNYDFIQERAHMASGSAQPLGFPAISSQNKNLKPEILSPKDKQSLNSQKPQFNGIGLPNEKVDIIIHSAEEITTQVTTDSKGNWTYQSPTNLTPGDHTITIKTRNSSGILTTITQAFTVYAAELPTSTVLPTSMPSSPTQTIPSPTIAVSSYTSPPISIPPTVVPITTKGGLPPTGNSSATTISVTGMTTLIIGLLMFIFAR